jgi:hypothetical protein
MVSLMTAEGMKMAVSERSFAALRKLSPRLRWLLSATLLAAVATGAGSAHARRIASYDGTWNVTFATTSGNCSASNTFPFAVSGSRVSSAGGGKVTGGIRRNGRVAVAVRVGLSHASGFGRLTGNYGAGRWSGVISGDRCSGSWQAIRS